MKKIKLFLLTALTLCLLGSMLACTVTTPATTTAGGSTPATTVPQPTGPNVTTPPASTVDPNATFTVSITVDSNCVIVGDTSKTVKAGGEVTFRIMIVRDNYFLNPEIGSYDPATGYYTITGVTENLTLSLIPEYHLSFNVSVKNGAASVNGSHVVEAGESLTLTPDTSKGPFAGWTSGKTLADGGALLSSDAEFVFTPSGNTTVYANYLETGSKYLLYDLNGGSTAEGSTSYIQKLDTSFYTSPNALNDKKIFTRTGYSLIEYNTKADGRGTGYSLGSKIKLDGDVTTLYCIWAKSTEERFFTTTAVAVQNLSKKTVSGVAITGYTGTDAVVVIPETIGGKPVIQINANAFKNTTMTTLVLSNNLLEVKANAFTGCGNLETVYMSDSIVKIPDEAFDDATYQNFKNFYLNAVEEPRYCKSYDGNYRVKWDRLMEGSDGDMIVYVSGSSSLHGVATEYLEALLDNKYTFVNYGTVRTTNSMVYMEAVSNFVDEGDIVIWGPENSEYQFGGNTLTFKLFRDLEGSLNVWRYVDISNYDLIFSAYTEYQGKRKGKAGVSYSQHGSIVDENGDYQDDVHKQYNTTPYTTPPFLIDLKTMKGTDEVANTGKDNGSNIALNTHATLAKKIIGQVRASGAEIYFGFCTLDEGALVSPGNTAAGQAAYDQMIKDIFGIETLGSVSDYIYATKYVYKANASSFHVNDYGRALNTYQLYTDLCEKLNITSVKGYKSLGTSFDGCIFE